MNRFRELFSYTPLFIYAFVTVTSHSHAILAEIPALPVVATVANMKLKTDVLFTQAEPLMTVVQAATQMFTG